MICWIQKVNLVKEYLEKMDGFIPVVGYSNDRSGYVNVNAIKGRYNPKVGDKIVAVCAETGPSVWRLSLIHI